ncbi:hypothetical protein CXB51_013451 [Gossypium anomalum]|uniref:Uncharacterized protein n=3 Tax=Gossypium TaxID=3633 RepID=A0A1U8PFP5_GOSHI|nr:uncharacterized protein LOC107958706 [Gossypium hirsutum]KAG4197305.1 hypothetical protein ERO13_A05G016000v2 [Gossypium hirsutum]KAG8495653.1 hypothetical protein CXB51_013451 [Gossypium anomalum]
MIYEPSSFYLSLCKHQKTTPPVSLPHHSFSPIMASILSSQGVVLATAMAVSGTVILLAFRLQKSYLLDQISQPSQQALRSCISSEGKKREEKKKKKVHFAEDVVDPRKDGEEFRKQLKNRVRINNSAALNSSTKFKKFGGGKDRGMPANRVALYTGILRDRGVQRLAYSC